MGQTTSCVDQETRDPKNDTEGTVLKVSRHLTEFIKRFFWTEVLSRVCFVKISYFFIVGQV